MRAIIRTGSSILLTFLLVYGCGRNDEDTAAAEADGTADAAVETETGGDTAASAPATGATAQPNDASRPVTVDDIDRWQEGMEGEIKAVQETVARMKTAPASEKGSLMMEATEQNTAAAGARAAGLDEERYKFVRSTLSEIVKLLTPPEQEGFDTTKMPQSARDEFRAGQEARLEQMAEDVPPYVVQALKPRALELRKKDLELVGTRLKAAQAR